MRFLITILFLFMAEMLHAQPYYFRRYQVEHGLSNNTVFSCVQELKGFMWFATKDGLNRFDGYAFKTFRHDPDDKNSIGNDLIYTLHLDQKQVLWAGTNKGIYRYHPENESFTLLEGTADLQISQIKSDKQGNLWFISNFRLYRFASAENKIFTYGDKVSFDATSVTQISDGTTWVSTVQGTLERFNPQNDNFTSLYVLNKNLSYNLRCISTIVELGEHKLLIGTTNQGFKTFDLKTHQTRDLRTFNKDNTPIFVRDIKRVAENEYWIATESGIYVYNDSSGLITHLEKIFGDQNSLSDNAVYTIFKDKEGGIWTGTFFGGVNYYSNPSSLFTKYSPKIGINAISGDAVREIIKDDQGCLWIGTEDAGLNRLDLKTGLFKNFLPNGKPSSIAYANIHGLMQDGDKLWIGTFEHGLDVMDLKTEKIIKHYTAGHKNSLRTNFIVTFCKTRSGEILVATINGIYKYNKKKDDFEPIRDLPFIFYDSIMEDSQGNIWAGSFNEGLFRFKIDLPGYKNFAHDQNDIKSLSKNAVNSVFEDRDQQIWVATDGGGLCKFNPKTQDFTRFNMKNGLPSNFLFRIEQDEKKMLWISSTKGLIKFDPKDLHVTVYTIANGLLTDQFNYASSFKDTDGRIYFGSVKGLISFQPNDIQQTNKRTRVFLTGFQINNGEGTINQQGSVLKKSILFTDSITLNYNQSSINIDFAALSYLSPSTTEYAYRMQGLDEEWQYLKTNRKVYFTKLAPGNYVFEAKALIQGSKEWSTENIKLHIIVKPPFWKSNIAYFIYFLIGTSLLTYLITQYHLRLKKKNERLMQVFELQKEKEIYQAKIEFFTNVAHEIRTPLTLIKGPMEKLMKETNQSANMAKNLIVMDRNTDRLLNLTNQLLDFRKTETDGFSLNFVKTDVVETLCDLVLQFHAAAEQKQLMFNCDLSDKEFSAYIDVEAFYKIMSNLIDNAIKYAATRVVIAIDNKDSDYFEISVSNDGHKIPAELSEKIFKPFFRAKETASKPGNGIGLSISRSLVELHRGTLVMDLSVTAINKFIIRLPIRQTMEFNLHGTWKKAQNL